MTPLPPDTASRPVHRATGRPLPLNQYAQPDRRIETVTRIIDYFDASHRTPRRMLISLPRVKFLEGGE